MIPRDVRQGMQKTLDQPISYGTLHPHYYIAMIIQAPMCCTLLPTNSLTTTSSPTTPTTITATSIVTRKVANENPFLNDLFHFTNHTGTYYMSAMSRNADDNVQGATGSNSKDSRFLHPARGMYHDVRRRLPYYLSDIKDGMNYRTIASVVRMLFVK